jgi:NAD+ kinase
MTLARGVRRKRSAFDPASIQCVGIIAAMHKRRIGAAVRDVVSWFDKRDVKCLLCRDNAANLSLPDLGVGLDAMADEADLMLAMGGDGTFLATARVAAPRGKPILGVNLGGFGFLAAIPSGAAMLESLEEAMAGKARVQERMMLAADVLRGGEAIGSFLALNDIVVGKGAFSRLFRLKTSVSGERVADFPADGMIIATPTGSTGYSLSAGGPVIDPGVRVIILTPICAHTLSARTLVVPGDRVVEMALPDPRGEEVNLTADGQEGIALQAGDCVEVRQAPFSARLVTLEDTTFYTKLRGKLGWGSQR